MPRGEDAKRHGLLRNILISPLEGEKKFLSELCELRNFREEYNLKYICRNSNFDRLLYFLKNINYDSDMLHHDKNNKGRLGILAQREAAFTLAEVLITLGIIGIVAAMTLPSVISKYQEKQTVTQLNATYSLLSQAIERMVDDNGDISTYGDDERTRVTTLFLMLQNYIQTTKVCPHNYKGCFDASPFSSLNYGYVLKNGVAIRLINGGTCEQDTTMDKTGGWELNPNVKGTHYGTYHHSCAYMYININGNTNAKLGKNTFLFAVVQNGIVPVGGPKESTSYNNISNCLNGQDMSECGAWIIYNKNMDYLHCPEQLGWDKATHCK